MTHSERIKYIILMLERTSTIFTDILELSWGADRIREARQILIGGKDTPLRTYTRLLLKMSEEEAIGVGLYLRRAQQ